MKKRFYAFIMYVCFATTFQITSAPSHILSLFFQEYPTTTNSSLKKELIAGIFVSYYGYKATSDHNGQTPFPLKQTTDTFSLLICQNPLPIFNIGTTIHHWQIPPDQEYLFYTINQITDKKSGIVLWNVLKKELDNSRNIPLETIIIHAHPQSIVLPTGVYVVQKGEHIVLPTLYVKEEINSTKNALSFLQTSDFFAPVHRVFRAD